MAGYAAFLHHHTSFVAGGADSSGYVNSARGLLHGRIVQRIAGLEVLGLPAEMGPLFVPLGYHAGPRPGMMVPGYPPGFPLHMAAAAAIGGSPRAFFLVSPLSALGCLALVFLLARELGLPKSWAAAGAVLLATFPTFVFQSVQSMSDVLATFWAMAAILTALLSRRRAAWALLAGAAFGIGVLVRPTNLLMALPLFFALPPVWHRRRLLLLGGLPFAAFWLVYSAIAYRSPLATGYGNVWREFSFTHFPARLLHYSTWMTTLLTPLVPLGWLGAAADVRLTRRDRALLLSWFAVFLLFYSFYLPYETWWYTRFLLPGVPALLLAALLLGRDLLASPALARRGAAALAGAAFLVIATTGAGFVVKNRVHKIYKLDRVYPDACRLAERTLPAKSLVLAMQLSGALEYYTNMTYVMWNWIAPEGPPPLLSQKAASSGYAWYALLAPFELEEARARLPGRWTELGRARDVVLWRIEQPSRPQ